MTAMGRLETEIDTNATRRMELERSLLSLKQQKSAAESSARSSGYSTATSPLVYQTPATTFTPEPAHHIPPLQQQQHVANAQYYPSTSPTSASSRAPSRPLSSSGNAAAPHDRRQVRSPAQQISTATTASSTTSRPLQQPVYSAQKSPPPLLLQHSNSFSSTASSSSPLSLPLAAPQSQSNITHTPLTASAFYQQQQLQQQQHQRFVHPAVYSQVRSSLSNSSHAQNHGSEQPAVPQRRTLRWADDDDI